MAADFRFIKFGFGFGFNGEKELRTRLAVQHLLVETDLTQLPITSQLVFAENQINFG